MALLSFIGQRWTLELGNDLLWGPLRLFEKAAIYFTTRERTFCVLSEKQTV